LSGLPLRGGNPNVDRLKYCVSYYPNNWDIVTSLGTPLIWRKLVADKRVIVTSRELSELARELGKDAVRSVRYLQEHAYITRILRGIFYVMTPEEREQGSILLSVYETVGEALNVKGVKNWYFGLETALKLNEVTHEFFAVDTVITDSFRTTKVIGIMGSKFQFLKWREGHFAFGIVRRGGVACSDREKTLLDIAYRRYQESVNAAFVAAPLREFMDQLDREKLRDYLERYPPGFRLVVRSQL